MKFTAFLILVSISLVNIVEAKEQIIHCKPNPPLKLVSKFLLGSKVFERKEGKWVPYCDADNEILEIFDESIACTVKHPLYVANRMSVEEKENQIKKCKSNKNIPSLHNKFVLDINPIESLCERERRNYFNGDFARVVCYTSRTSGF